MSIAQRRAQAARCAASMGLDPAELAAGAEAAWSNLGPNRVLFEHALSVASVTLLAAQRVREAEPVG